MKSKKQDDLMGKRTAKQQRLESKKILETECFNRIVRERLKSINEIIEDEHISTSLKYDLVNIRTQSILSNALPQLRAELEKITLQFDGHAALAGLSARPNNVVPFSK